MNAALPVLFVFLALAIYLGIRSRRGKDMDLEQWTVGARGFGSIFVFLLLAGEIYTTFTFLGGSGWAYGKGGPAFYILSYGCLAYIISYWLLPVIWRYAKENNLVSQSDFFVSKYRSPYLGVLVALVGVVAMVPYLVLQLKGLGLIVSTASYGAIPEWVAVVIGVAALVIYVTISGIHGSAWTAVAKDITVLSIVVFLGIYLPLHYYGGFENMFQQIEQAKPGFLTLPKEIYSPWWFVSTVLLTALGFYMWPHTASILLATTLAGLTQIHKGQKQCLAKDSSAGSGRRPTARNRDERDFIEARYQEKARRSYVRLVLALVGIIRVRQLIERRKPWTRPPLAEPSPLEWTPTRVAVALDRRTSGHLPTTETDASSIGLVPSSSSTSGWRARGFPDLLPHERGAL